MWPVALIVINSCELLLFFILAHFCINTRKMSVFVIVTFVSYKYRSYKELTKAAVRYVKVGQSLRLMGLVHSLDTVCKGKTCKTKIDFELLPTF
jgi:hypothetical protein